MTLLSRWRLLMITLPCFSACNGNERAADLSEHPSLALHAEAYNREVTVRLDGRFAPPCPVFDVSATINGRAMRLVAAGGFQENFWSREGSCTTPSFEATVPDDGVIDPDLEIRVTDSSGALTMRTQHLLSVPRLVLEQPASGVLRTLEQAKVRVEPSALSFKSPIIIEYIPTLDPRVPPKPLETPMGFLVTAKDLGTTWSKNEISFTVMSDDGVPSTGVIALGREADYARLAAPILACEGASACTADVLSTTNDSPRTSASYAPW